MFGIFDFDNEKKKETKDEYTEVKKNIFDKYEKNPILVPSSDHEWKAKAVYNPAAIYLDGNIHLLYRAQSKNGVSSIGYAVGNDGFNFDDLGEPIFSPSQDFELPTKVGWNSGCEDPRITKIGERLYMTYTAYDGTNPPRVALTSISVEDFLNKKFNWEKSKLISPPGVDDKDACIIKSERLGLLAFHRLGNSIWIDKLKDLDFPDVKFLTGGIIAHARNDMWDNVKIGMAAPPIETEKGLLLLYHAVSNPGFSYKIGAMLLSYSDPHEILARSNEPLLYPEMSFEVSGQISNVVYSCGAIVKDETIFLYYGGGDTVTCVATMRMRDLLSTLLN